MNYPNFDALYAQQEADARSRQLGRIERKLDALLAANGAFQGAMRAIANEESAPAWIKRRILEEETILDDALRRLRSIK